jgi:hypothetical protein
LIQLFL